MNQRKFNPSTWPSLSPTDKPDIDNKLVTAMQTKNLPLILSIHLSSMPSAESPRRIQSTFSRKFNRH